MFANEWPRYYLAFSEQCCQLSRKVRNRYSKFFW